MERFCDRFFDHDYAKAAKIPKEETVKKPQIITSLEIQINNLVIHLDEIILNHLNEHQKIKIGMCLGLDQCECTKSTDLVEKKHISYVDCTSIQESVNLPKL